ncbi:DsdX permease [Cedecea neteri]|uniref:DsdX permease n=1 Tax=Cedecea neteri TaxID=158822 RepID=A0A2X2VB02_9ENTR|nr:DsdX permease [Cedecea neteri]
MGSQIWVVGTLLASIILIVLTIVKLKLHPFLRAAAGELFRRRDDGHGPAGDG